MGERQGVVRLEARLRCARSDLLSRIERYQEGPRSDHQDRSAATGHPCYGRKAVVYFQMNRRFSTQNICASQPSYARKRGEGVETVNRKTRSGPSRDLRACLRLGPISGSHQRKRRRIAMEASPEAAYMAAPERFAKRQVALAPRAPSIHGSRRGVDRHRARADRAACVTKSGCSDRPPNWYRSGIGCGRKGSVIENFLIALSPP